MEHPEQYSYENQVDDFLTRRDDLLIAAASAIDQYSTCHLDEQGRPVFRAIWYAEGNMYLLESRTYPEQSELGEDQEETTQKEWSDSIKLACDYTITRSAKLTEIMLNSSDFWFSTQTGQVCRIDEDREVIKNKTVDENLSHLAQVLEMLECRKGRTQIDETVIALELNYYMAGDDVRQYIDTMKHIGKHVRGRQRRLHYLTKNVVTLVMKQEPLFTQDMLELRLEEELGVSHETA